MLQTKVNNGIQLKERVKKYQMVISMQLSGLL